MRFSRRATARRWLTLSLPPPARRYGSTCPPPLPTEQQRARSSQAPPRARARKKRITRSPCSRRMPSRRRRHQRPASCGPLSQTTTPRRATTRSRCTDSRNHIRSRACSNLRKSKGASSICVRSLLLVSSSFLLPCSHSRSLASSSRRSACTALRGDPLSAAARASPLTALRTSPLTAIRYGGFATVDGDAYFKSQRGDVLIANLERVPGITMHVGLPPTAGFGDDAGDDADVLAIAIDGPCISFVLLSPSILFIRFRFFCSSLLSFFLLSKGRMPRRARRRRR